MSKIHFRNLLFCYCLLFIPQFLSAQNIKHAKEIIDTLASPSMFGRGYVNNGCGIAADYVENQMKVIGLQPFGATYKQDFLVDVKTYPSVVSLKINGVKLVPSEDFTIMTGSPSIRGQFKVIVIDSNWFIHFKKIINLKKKDLSKTFIAYNPRELKGAKRKLADSLFRNNIYGCAGFIHLTNKKSTSWSVVSPKDVLPFPVLTVYSASPKKMKDAEVEIELKSIDNYKVSNVAGFIPGTSQIDSFMVITAHYDHLGMMGSEALFPGANDNASGTAMMLDLASYYMMPEHRQTYNIVFIAFAGEELGLKGSEYAAEHPLFPLDKIKFLINLDMVGTGSEGITVVNGIQLPAYYDRLVKINSDNEYILKVAKRGESCNSDHCPFYNKKVPAIFIYSLGKEFTEYHNTKDLAKNLPLTEYEDIFRLLRDFINTL
jgi:hypothetical protein